MDGIDQEGRNSFLQSLPRKVGELRSALSTVFADPKGTRVRDELRRRVQSLSALARSFQLNALADGLREGSAHLDAVRSAAELSSRDLETLAEIIASLPTLAKRDEPSFDAAERESVPLMDRASRPATTLRYGVDARGIFNPDGSIKPELQAELQHTTSDRKTDQPAERKTLTGLPTPAPQSPVPIAASPATSSRSSHTTGSFQPLKLEVRPGSTPIVVLAVGSAALAQDARRVLPNECEVATAVNLSDAITNARNIAPDVILAECAAPADGLGLIAALRGDPLTDFLPVVLVAREYDVVDPAHARAQGAAEVVRLPADLTRLRDALERAANGLLPAPSVPTGMGDVTLEELTRTLQEEIRRGLLGAARPGDGVQRVSMGEGSDVLAATWEAIARVRETVERRSRGRVRFTVPMAPLGLGGAHVMALGDDDDAVLDEGGDDPLPGRTALIVDDEPSVVWFFSGLLRDAGMTTFECTDGNEALAKAREHLPDVVIADILMPGLDGFGLCRAIRRDVSLRHTPVVLLSWREDLLVRMRELGAQAQGFVRKEARGEAILSRVRSVLRPRIRLLSRIETLDKGAELRGRVERVGVFALLQATARRHDDVTLSVSDSFSVTEIDLRAGELVSVVRTAQDGSLSRGERALLQVLGVTSARFTLRVSSTAIRSNLTGDWATLLEGAASLLSTTEDAVSGAALMDVATLDLDTEAVLAHARSLPTAMRALVERIAKGESPREMIRQGGVAAQELEPLLVEIVRRGAVRAVRGVSGEDLVAPRLAASRTGSTLRPASLQKPSNETPAPVRKPESSKPEASAGASTTGAHRAMQVESRAPTQPVESTRPAKRVSGSWRPPTRMEEVLQPGFGLADAGADTLASAVLREITDPPPEGTENAVAPKIPAPPPVPKVNSNPPAHSVPAVEREKEKAPAAPSAPLETESVATPASAASTEDEPELEPVIVDATSETDATKAVPEVVEGMRDAPVSTIETTNTRAPIESPKDESKSVEAAPSESDSSAPSAHSASATEEASAAPLQTKRRVRGRAKRREEEDEEQEAKPEAAAAQPSQSVTQTAEPAPRGTPWGWVLGGFVVLAGGGYAIVASTMKEAPASQQSATTDVPVAQSVDVVSTPSVVSDVPVAQVVGNDVVSVRADVGEARTDSAVDVVQALEASDVATIDVREASSSFAWVDPAPYLDGGVLPPNRGLLVIDGPAPADVRVQIGRESPIALPVRLVLAPGFYQVRYLRGRRTGLLLPTIEAGKAVRATVPEELTR